jgi:hypothetical protein
MGSHGRPCENGRERAIQLCKALTLAMTRCITGGREGAILARLIRPEEDRLPTEADNANYI